MKIRSNSGGTNEDSNKSSYCRVCGLVFKREDFVDICTNCGNILQDDGYGISGDNFGSEAGSTAYNKGQLSITPETIDKRVR